MRNKNSKANPRLTLWLERVGLSEGGGEGTERGKEGWGQARNGRKGRRKGKKERDREKLLIFPVISSGFTVFLSTGPNQH